MNTAQRAIAYRVALNGRGRDIENALARACAELPAHLEEQAERVWEGALLAEAQPWQLNALVDEGNWPAVVALADLSGEDPWSKVVRYNREHYAKWTLREEPETA